MRNLDTLTTDELETAANDLRNAGLVVQHAGHMTDRAVDSITGAVCATGAIDVATFRRLCYLDDIKRFGIFDRHKFASRYRADNACLVMACAIPTDLCKSCDYTRACPTHGPLCDAEAASWERIVHYNDAHCEGGDVLISVFDHAAELAERTAADKRKMLTGLPLATLAALPRPFATV